jgi:VIT1/CCC1 family predicted Fe2+/Mn2+ transporter
MSAWRAHHDDVPLPLRRAENMPHRELHRTDRIGWLRAAVLGANDGIVSTASLVVGVAASDAGRGQVLVAGVAGLVAGALSMAAGEYVSVSSQADTERADVARERQELAAAPGAEEDVADRDLCRARPRSGPRADRGTATDR